jgi:hypothetical protein
MAGDLGDKALRTLRPASGGNLHRAMVAGTFAPVVTGLVPTLQAGIVEKHEEWIVAGSLGPVGHLEA